MFNLSSIAANPLLLTVSVITPEGETLVLRPLETTDLDELAQFLANLSPETRHFSTFDGYDRAAAQALCDSIARYDKLRFVIQSGASQWIVGLLEFSFAILEADRLRYTAYGIALDSAVDCRFGPTLADDYQGKGLGTLVLPFVKDAARSFGKRRVILWGGVLADNARALRFYEKNGFKALGKFLNHDWIEAIDMLLDL